VLDPTNPPPADVLLAAGEPPVPSKSAGSLVAEQATGEMTLATPSATSTPSESMMSFFCLMFANSFPLHRSVAQSYTNQVLPAAYKVRER
jgi:hypothetical protein